MLTTTLRFLFFLLLASGLYEFGYSQEKSSVEEINIFKEIKIIGNKTTKNNIIVRELPFQIGDTVLVSELKRVLERTRSNLLNTLLFNFVTVEPVYFDSTYISIYITVEERWYWWPIPIFNIQETNFNTWWVDKNYDRVNYGLFVAKENFRGRKETIKFKFQRGFTEQFGIEYNVPYVNKKNTNGLSLGIGYGRNREINYASTGNIRDYYRADNGYVMEKLSGVLGYELRPKLYNRHIFHLEYRDISISDSLFVRNTGFLNSGSKTMRALSLTYIVKRDKRNFKSYPTTGYYFDFEGVKDGLGIFNTNPNGLYFTSQLRRFWELSDRFYFSGSVKTKLTVKELPYHFFNIRGYRNDFVRGYELYVVNGGNYGIVKTQLRYALLKGKMFRVKPIRASKFNKIPLSIYAGVFFDAGYVDSNVDNQNNFLNNTALYGSGVGFDFVSYYDIVFRLEYSFNREGESGLFLHFVSPI